MPAAAGKNEDLGSAAISHQFLTNYFTTRAAIATPRARCAVLWGALGPAACSINIF